MEIASKVILFAVVFIQLALGSTALKSSSTRPETCEEPMGLMTGSVGADQLSASSEYNVRCRSDRGRLNLEEGVGAWCAKANDQNQYLQVDFRSPKSLTGIVTQGRQDAAQWVTSYALRFSNDGRTWNPVFNDAGANQVFPGNFDQNTHVTHRFARPIRARYVRVLPLTWHGHISMRMEFLGCDFDGPLETGLTQAPEICSDPMGLKNGSLGADQLTASSEHSNVCRKDLARLDNKTDAGSWCSKANDKNQYLQVDFRSPKTLTGIVTQGRQHAAQWVTSYALQISDNGKTWNPVFNDAEYNQVFAGNFDQNTHVTHRFRRPIRARYVRVLPLTWHSHISMRMELLGCDGKPASVKILPVTIAGLTSTAPETCNEPMGLKNGSVGADQLSASSEYSLTCRSDRGRLNLEDGVGSWCAKTNDKNQFLQVDFHIPKTLTGIVTQGRQDAAQWVTSYEILFSENGRAWNLVLNDAGANQVFSGNFDQNTHVTHRFARPIRARFVRVLPLTWHGHISMRMEFLGCDFDGPLETVLSRGWTFSIADGIQERKGQQNTVYKEGDSSKDGSCTICKSNHMVACLTPEQHPDRNDYVLETRPVSGSCCPEIVRTRCKDQNGQERKVGEEWSSEDDACTTYVCSKRHDGQVRTVERKIVCNTECPVMKQNRNHRTDSTGCCPICSAELPTKSEDDRCRLRLVENSVGVFEVISEVGTCRNTEPVPDLTECAGLCRSRTTFWSDTFNKFDPTCDCCSATNTVTRSVQLTCADGSRIAHAYRQPTECSCSADSDDDQQTLTKNVL